MKHSAIPWNYRRESEPSEYGFYNTKNWIIYNQNRIIARVKEEPNREEMAFSNAKFITHLANVYEESVKSLKQIAENSCGHSFHCNCARRIAENALARLEAR